MTTSNIKNTIETTIDAAWEDRDNINLSTQGTVRSAVETALDMLDKGEARVAEPQDDGNWIVNQWLKKAVLLSFKLNDMMLIDSGADYAMGGHAPEGKSPEGKSMAGKSRAGHAMWWDKVPSKFIGWKEEDFRKSGFRAVPGCIVRRSAYVAPGVVLMPSFISIGAFVDSGTMVDTWATVGSCAQIGKNVHLSGGAGIGGVLEPLQTGPVIIEDDCFIGARSEVVEGVVVERGAVLSMGVFIGASTKIVNRMTGEVHMGRVPAGAVVVPGTLPGKPLADGTPGPNLACAVIIKEVDEKTRAKTSINELLRD